MSIPAAIFTADFDHSVSDIPATIVAFGVTLTGTASEARKTKDVQDEGVLQPVELIAQAKRADFTVKVPSANDTVTVDGVKYTGMDVTDSVCKLFLDLTLRRA